MKQKIVKDPLYGYISIDTDIFEQVIDTRFFQRLRRIEQTSMRCLYPSARHDRFVHSMAVGGVSISYTGAPFTETKYPTIVKDEYM